MSVRCNNPSLYDVTPHWRAVGLETPDQVRSEILAQPAGEWDEAISLHVKGCSFCASLAEALRKMTRAVKVTGKAPQVQFAVCPSVETLARYKWDEVSSAGERGAIEEHLNKCPACQADERWLALTEDATPAKMFSRRWYFPAAAALLVGSILFTQHFKASAPKRPNYADLAAVPALDAADLLAVSVPADRPLVQNVITDYNNHRYPRAEQRSRELIATSDNPSAELVMAMSMYRRGHLDQAYTAMLESERTAPMSYYRCWTLLQLALLSGDRKTVERECKHVRDHAEYGPKAQKILAAVAARQAS